MKFKVTYDDVQKGKRWSATDCPIALALNRDHPVDGGWTVTEYSAWHSVDDIDDAPSKMFMPGDARRFVIRFDSCGHAGVMWDQEFELEDL